MIDAEGFRPNVGIILTNGKGQVLWARRHGHDAWQFPQGGINQGETPEQAMLRELWEEIGLEPEDVKIVAQTRGWLRYRLPRRYVRHENPPPVCIGQKQKWFLLSLQSSAEHIYLNKCQPPEFDDWEWVSYWYPLNQVVSFKREVYRKALLELAPRLPIIES
ncbi:RNA pyrophosphohydrolase [Agitococcus lubricus]|uniref:RNA pyrophosphohydrolase n=1 Tax=Agitococcus lubricus TaxID=1077255 RepID=A0A2T5IZY3_9GAMM|nr:RNA pyrophosphohydrolase [Agitococcus lubricus]PTQ89544.1 putative (di)nucleoside polyphosphate hydrolase [Agitococcus lubricus]